VLVTLSSPLTGGFGDLEALSAIEALDSGDYAHADELTTSR
jgi:hypothetical protein